MRTMSAVGAADLLRPPCRGTQQTINQNRTASLVQQGIAVVTYRCHAVHGGCWNSCIARNANAALLGEATQLKRRTLGV